MPLNSAPKSLLSALFSGILTTPLNVITGFRGKVTAVFPLPLILVYLPVPATYSQVPLKLVRGLPSSANTVLTSPFHRAVVVLPSFYAQLHELALRSYIT